MTKKGGTPAGIYIKQIVKAHGGDISVLSHESEGSIFTVCLPIKPPPSIL